jgi:hypothetical protein
MRESWFKTISVPSSGDPAIPAIVQAPPDAAFRVLIRNAGATLLLVSLNPTSFVDTVPAPDTYQIPAGQSDSLVLAPGQTLCIASTGAGGTACIAASEAIPYDLRS